MIILAGCRNRLRGKARLRNQSKETHGSCHSIRWMAIVVSFSVRTEFFDPRQAAGRPGRSDRVMLPPLFPEGSE